MDFVKITALKDQILNGIALKKGDNHSIPKVLYEQLAINGQELVAIVIEPKKEELLNFTVKRREEIFHKDEDFSNE